MSQAVYREITREIVAILKGGAVPTWIRPWSRWSLRPNGHLFTGTNSLILGFAADKKGYRSPYWLTEAQGKRYRGEVRDGEEGTRVVRPVIAPLPAGAMDPRLGLVVPGERQWKTRDGKRLTVRTRPYDVYNAEQFDKLPRRFHEPPDSSGPDFERTREFFEVIGARIKDGPKPSYGPAEDSIWMPPLSLSGTREHYFATLAHELGHWTGHETRLAREFGRRGTPEYAFEELVAELASAYVLAVNGLPAIPREDHAAYLDHWIEALERDDQAFHTAATLGQRAADYLTIAAAAGRVKELEERRLDDRDYVAVYLDQVDVGPNPVLVAIGLHARGRRVLLGAGRGATEDSARERAALALLRSLLGRGLCPDRSRLFVIGAATGLRRSVRAVFGPSCFLQRCRATARRAVIEELRRTRRNGEDDAGDQDSERTSPEKVRERIQLAYEAGVDLGMRELHALARQLESEGDVAAARALRTSPANLFTVDRLGLRPPLSRSLSTTHVVSRAPWHLPQRICNPPSWRDDKMALQWCVASFLETETESTQRIAGYAGLSSLATRLQAAS